MSHSLQSNRIRIRSSIGNCIMGVPQCFSTRFTVRRDSSQQMHKACCSVHLQNMRPVLWTQGHAACETPQEAGCTQSTGLLSRL